MISIFLIKKKFFGNNSLVLVEGFIFIFYFQKINIVLHVYFCAIVQHSLSSFTFQSKSNKMDQSKHTYSQGSFCKSKRIFTILHGRHINDCKEKDKISLGKINPTPLPFSALFIPYKFYQVDSSIFLRTQFFFFAQRVSQRE